MEAFMDGWKTEMQDVFRPYRLILAVI